MIICPHCGTPNDANARFCSACGRPIQDRVEIVQPEPDDEPPTMISSRDNLEEAQTLNVSHRPPGPPEAEQPYPYPPSASYSSPPNANSQGNSEGGGSKRTLIIVGGVMLLLLLCCCCCALTTVIGGALSDEEFWRELERELSMLSLTVAPFV
jgi:hypothetical protein